MQRSVAEQLKADDNDHANTKLHHLPANTIKSYENINSADVVPQSEIPVVVHTSVVGCACHPISELPNCNNCKHMKTKMMEIERRVDYIFDLTQKIYNAIKKSAVRGTNLKQSDSEVLNNKHQPPNLTISEYYDSSTDLSFTNLSSQMISAKMA